MSKNYNEFINEFGEYMIEPIQMIGFEVSVNYIPLRNHIIAYQMLNDNELYNQLSDNDKFNWKQQFLSPEQENKHIQIMTNQYCDMCWDWLDNQKELKEVITLTYSNDEMYSLIEILMKDLWEQTIFSK